MPSASTTLTVTEYDFGVPSGFRSESEVCQVILPVCGSIEIPVPGAETE